MSMEEMNTIIGRAASDTTYRARFFENFDAAVSAYDLTPAERILLKRVTPDKFEAIFKKLEDWGQPLSSASMELLQLIYGPQLQDDERSATGTWQLAHPEVTIKKQMPRQPSATIAGVPTRTLLIFAGVAILGVILSLILIVALGISRSGTPDATAAPSEGPNVISTGGPGECPCVCIEQCAEGAVTCITVCADCQENRCVP